MKLIIDIDDETYNDIKKGKIYSSFRDVPLESTNSIANGTPLLKGHGRLIDADAFERRCMFDSDIEDMQDVIYALRDYKPIIEADKAESEDEEHIDGKI